MYLFIYPCYFVILRLPLCILLCLDWFDQYFWWDNSMLFYKAVVLSFSLLTIIYLAVIQLIDIWVAATLELVWTQTRGHSLLHLLVHMSEVKVTHLCTALCDPVDYTFHGIFQAGILEWVTLPFSKGSCQPRDQTQVSHIVGGFFTSWVTMAAQEYWSG